MEVEGKRGGVEEVEETEVAVEVEERSRRWWVFILVVWGKGRG